MILKQTILFFVLKYITPPYFTLAVPLPVYDVIERDWLSV